MKTVKADIWQYYANGLPICIPTNGNINKKGAAVMGRGLAFQAMRKFHNLPFMLAAAIKKDGNRTFYFKEFNIYTVPTKHNWSEKSDINLIVKSCEQLISLAEFNQHPTVFIPKLGCGNGQLNWDSVRGRISKFMDQEKFMFVEYPSKADKLLDLCDKMLYDLAALCMQNHITKKEVQEFSQELEELRKLP